MKDEQKSKSQLIRELQELRRHIAETEAAQARQDNPPSFLDFAEGAASPIFVFDNLSIRYVNPATARLTGYTREELLAANMWELVDPESREVLRDRLAAWQRGESVPSKSEFKVVTRNGETRWLNADTNHFTFDGTRAALVIGSDVTDHKRDHEALHESEARLQAIIENLPFELWVRDADGRCTMQNPYAVLQWGNQVGKLPEQTARDNEILTVWQSNNLRAFAGEVVKGEFEITEGEQAGSYYNVVSPIIVHGEIHGIVIVNIDITDRKRADKAVRESEMKFRTLAQTAETAILIYQDSKMTYVNPYAVAISGYSVEEQMSMDFWEIVHPDDREQARDRGLRRLNGEPVPSRYELRILSKSGEERWLDFSARPIELGGKPSVLGIGLDITDRKRAEDELKATQERLQHVVAFSPAIIFLLKVDDGEFKTEWVSDSLARLCGYEGDEIEFASWWQDHIHPDDRDRVHSQIANLFENDRLVQEYRFQHKDGGYLWIHDETRLLRDDAGKPSEVIGSWVDVSERRGAEDALRTSEERFRGAFEYAPNGVTLDRPDGSLLRVNRAVIDLLGYSEREMLAMRFSSITHPDDIDGFERETRRMLEGEIESFTIEQRYFHKDGRVIWASVSSTSVRDPQGTPEYLITQIRDITERKQAEEQIHFQASLLDQVRNAVIAIDLDQRIVFWNSFAETLYQWKREEALGRLITELILPREFQPAAEEAAEGLRTSGYWEGEFQVCRKDGSRLPAYVHDSVIRATDGTIIGVVGVSADLSERKRLDRALWESEDKFRSFMQHLPGYAWIKEPDGRYVYLNERLRETLWNHADDWPGRTDKELFSPEMAAEFRRNDETVLKERQDHQFIEEWIWKGQVRYALVTKFPIFDAQGELMLLAGVSVDITDLKEAEESLRTQKEILQKIFDHIPVMINVIDSDGRIKLVNREWESTVGWGMAEIEQQNIDLLADAYPDPVDYKQARDFIDEASGRWADFRPRLKNGQVIDTMWARVRLSDGTTIGIGQDITDRKRAEEALRTSEERFRGCFDLGLIGMALATPKGFLEVNDKLCDILGYNRTELLYRRWDEFTHPDDLEADAASFARIMAGEFDDYTVEKRFIRKDGSIVYAIISMKCVRTAEGNVDYFVALVQDTTEQKRAAESLSRHAAQLAAVHDVELEISAQSELPRVLEVVTRRAGEMLNAHHCSIYIRDHELEQLKLVASLHSELIGLRVKEGDGLVGRVAVTGVTESVDDYATWNGRSAVFDGQGFGPTLGAPLKWQQTVIGAIGLARKPGDPLFTRDDINFLDRIATQASVAIHQATLFDEVREGHARLQVLSHRLIDAQEDERKRLARELHDQIGQALTAVQIRLQYLQTSSSSTDSAERVEQCLAVIDEALIQVHDLSLDLRPSLLDDLGLLAALRWYVNRVTSLAGLEDSISADELDSRVSPEVETACFRIAQEAMVNVLRHASAKKVSVEVKYSNPELRLRIMDDGVGFDVRAALRRVGTGASLGLQGMQERAAAVGGIVDIKSRPGHGAEIRATFVLKEASG